MRLIDLEVDTPGLLQSSEFFGERLLTSASSRYRCRPGAACQSGCQVGAGLQTLSYLTELVCSMHKGENAESERLQCQLRRRVESPV